MAKNFESIFDNATDVTNAFDVMFGADEDDKLIEAVLAMGEADLPSDEELHQLDDEATAADIRKELGPDHDSKGADAPTCDSSDSFDIKDEDLDIGCPKYGVQDAVQKSAPDEENLEDESKKATNSMGKEYAKQIDSKYEAALNSLFEEAEEDLPSTDAEDDAEAEVAEVEPVDNADELEEDLPEEAAVEEGDPGDETNAEVKKDEQEAEKVNESDVSIDKFEDDLDCDECRREGKCKDTEAAEGTKGGSPLKEESTSIDDLEDDIDCDPERREGKCKEDEDPEGTKGESPLKEADDKFADEDELAEDEIIDDAMDDEGEISDEELEDLLGDDDDDDLIDAVMND